MKIQYIACYSLMFVAAMSLAGCGKGVVSDSEATSFIRVFYSEATTRITPNRDGFRGVFVWPAEQRLEKYDIARVASPLIDSSPSWGKYLGVGQSSVDDRNYQTALRVTLESKEAASQFLDFCRAMGHQDGVVLIYKDEESTIEDRIEEIVEKYTESTNGEQAGAVRPLSR